MSHPDPSCIITRFDSMADGRWMSVVRSARDAICCDSRHIEAKRRCHAGEIWVAITVAQAHRNAAGTDLTGSGDTSDIPTGSPRHWKPCGPAWRTCIVDGFTRSAAGVTENDVLLGSSSNSVWKATKAKSFFQNPTVLWSWLPQQQLWHREPCTSSPEKADKR